MIGVGILGSGFISDCYADALLDVRNGQLVACYSRSGERARRPSPRSGDLMSRLTGIWTLSAPTRACRSSSWRCPTKCISKPCEIAARHGKAIICTKPLGRTEAEAQKILDAANKAGVWHGYAESSVFSPNVAKAYEMVQAGGIGELLTMRAREGHSGPHAPHFWDAETAGGGALLDMGCHTVESARHFFGKDNKVTEVLAWGATLAHSRQDDRRGLLRSRC